MYYFAYGSCMNVRDIKRTVDAKPVGAAVLKDYRFGYRAYSKARKGGVADIIPETGNEVEGILFEVPDFKGLDKREGHPHFYERIEVNVQLLETKEWVKAKTYSVVEKSEVDIAPFAYYSSLIIEGAKELTEEYQQKIKVLTKKLQNDPQSYE
ncbi:gamma-glutamylcyclotransferase family protein [Alteribacillus bidgolensis]|uniref:Cation transport regulator ChaC n=1 Tax=Alteribacillus bidgolensis TaxID=930129 RepID=A0A1G8D5U7_9BACI|nr:gamma-glutamylcyclotransferase family protein [Alteribacillus bidgolensis]SDH53115.1 Cation transport regulator ChaC [Alteribacillus bidgolensis]